jgi:hypothetical protein
MSAQPALPGRDWPHDGRDRGAGWPCHGDDGRRGDHDALTLPLDRPRGLGRNDAAQGQGRGRSLPLRRPAAAVADFRLVRLDHGLYRPNRTQQRRGSDMDDVTTGGTGYVTSDVTWMTYAELGRVRGISTASAKRLAIRRRWRRHQGNDGTARVAVPATEAAPREGRSGDDTSDITPAVEVLRQAVEALRERAASADTRAEAAERRAGAAETRADASAMEVVAIQARLAEAERAHAVARTDAQAAQASAAALRQADVERRSRGRWARLRAAWRGEWPVGC